MLDTRGLSCPQPVILVQDSVKKGSVNLLEVLADNKCSVENITRFAENSGYEVTVSEQNDEYIIKLSKRI